MSRRQRHICLVLAVLAVLVAAGCSIPRHKADQPASKVAVTRAEAEAVYERYLKVRASALELLDEQPLTAVEADPVLAIDTGALLVARRLLLEGRPDDSQDLEIVDVLAPRLTEYPLWYVVVARDGVRDLTKVQIFQRLTSTSTWELVASPEILSSTELPELRTDESGALLQIAPDGDAGLSATPSQALADYATVLADPADPARERVTEDSFVQQMRDVVAAQTRIPGVTFSQTWEDQPVQYALRTEDGGALVFGTLVREDRYSIADGTRVNWPAGSEQEAFLVGDLYSAAVLRYFHQLLIYVPPTGAGTPFVMGQYGGVVAADGY
jgi:outer membrane murein-binding lipoprotein Lpp